MVPFSRLLITKGDLCLSSRQVGYTAQPTSFNSRLLSTYQIKWLRSLVYPIHKRGSGEFSGSLETQSPRALPFNPEGGARSLLGDQNDLTAHAHILGPADATCRVQACLSKEADRDRRRGQSAATHEGEASPPPGR